METVVVTGIRASLQSAQAIKQNSDQVVDSITAVDIGALPDRSVAEALQRVPGVQVTRTDAVHDPLRWAGFGNGVFIRGLSWVSSLTNGFETFGAENGRTISFADVSPSLMSGVDVYKNPDATMIEGGVGGVVDLKTRKPFDAEGRVIAVGGDYSYGTLSEKFAPSINALVSDRWQTRIGEIGALLSVDYQDLRASNGLVSTGAYTGTCGSANTSYTLPCPSTGQVYFPVGLTSDEQIGYRHMDWKQPRVTLDGTVQWRPSEKLEFTAMAIWSKAEPQSNEHNVAWDLYPVVPQTNQSALGNYKFDSKGNFIGGTIYNAFENSSYANYFDTRFDARHHINGNYSLSMKYDPTDRFHIKADVQYVDSRAYMYSVTMYNSIKYKYFCHFPENGWSGPGYNNGLPPPSVGSTPGGCYNGTDAAKDARYWPNAPQIDVTADLSTDAPKITYTGAGAAALGDPSNYLWGAAMDHVENNYAHAWATKVDFTYDFAGPIAKWIKNADFGGRISLKQATSRRSNWNWGKTTFKIWSNGWTGVPDAPAGYTPSAACLAEYSAANGPKLCQERDGIGDFSTALSTPYVYKYKFPAIFGTSMPAVWEANPAWLQKGIGAVWAGTGTKGGGMQAIEANATKLAGITGMWQPLAVGSGCNVNTPEYMCDGIYTGTNPTSNGGGINGQTEDTYAGYMQFDFAHDTFFGSETPIDGNIGVRIIHTETTSTGYVILGKVSKCPTNLATRDDTTCAGNAEAQAFVNNGTPDYHNDMGSLKIAAPTVTNKYTDILPSFNFRAHLSDTLQFRAAFSQGVVRPDFSNTQNYTLYGFNFNGGMISGQTVVTDPATKAITGSTPCSTTKACAGMRGSGGNPYLKPLRSNNYDASIEWFFAPTGSVSFALFHKDITNYFMSATTPETYTHNGVTETFETTRYVNGDKGKLEGFEVAYQQFYDQLPGAWGGIGIQANYTKLYNHGGHNTATNINDTGLATGSLTGVSLANNAALPMEGMSDDSANFALMYAKYDIDARLAYNWRSRFLVNSSATNLNQPVFQRNYGQVDASVLYSFLDHYKVGFQVNNLLKQTTVLEIGGLPILPITQTPKYEWVEGERKFSIVLRANW